MLGCRIYTLTREAVQCTDRAVLNDSSSHSRRVNVTKEFDSFLYDMQRAPEVHFEQPPCVLLRRSLGFREHSKPSVAKHDVKSAIDLLGLCECMLNI